VTLHPGRYELICNLPNHYADGMYAQLVVSWAAPIGPYTVTFVKGENMTQPGSSCSSLAVTTI
jgi:Sulfocyanin (SoxE) domain